MKKIFILFLMSLLMLTSVSLKAQCRYCNSYEDYVAGRWQPLDTVYFDQHTKSHQVWWGGSDFTLKTGDKVLDKMLKKEVFAVMQADTIYVNCRRLLLGLVIATLITVLLPDNFFSTYARWPLLNMFIN